MSDTRTLNLLPLGLVLALTSGSAAPEPEPPAAAPLAPAGNPALPPGWYSGDTHVHTQPCGGGADIGSAVLVQQQLAADVSVGCGLYWNHTEDLPGELNYFQNYAPMVSGMLDPASDPLADTLLQFGVEVSGFLGAQFGHISGLGINSGSFPNLPYPGPILDFFRAQTGGIAGYAHVRWPHDYTTLTNAQLSHLVPAMLPVDLAMGAVDFIEAYGWDPADALDWRGAHYKLLNSGLRVALVGGTDNTCIYPLLGAVQTFARLDGQGLSFDVWLQAVKAGRTSISKDGSIFLDLEVGSVGIGGEASLGAPGAVNALITLSAPLGIATQTTLELIQDGLPVVQIPVLLPQGGELSFIESVPFSQSGWLVAHLDGAAHTGAVYVIVNGQPVASTTDATYFRDICQRLISPPPVFSFAGSEAAIAARSTSALLIFEALAALDAPPPAGVSRYGLSTPACAGPIAIGITAAPLAGGAELAVNCVHAPPQAPGVLVIGGDQDLLGLEILGAQFYIDADPPPSVFPLLSNSGGYAARDFLLPASLVGVELHAQFGWLNPQACQGPGILSASDALQIVVQ